MAFEADEQFDAHVDELFATHGGILTLPKTVITEEAGDFDSRRIINLGGVQDADRASRGCPQVGGPKECSLYKVACSGGGQSCVIEEAQSRADH